MVGAVVYEEVEKDLEAGAFVESLNCEEEVEEVEDEEQKKVCDKEEIEEIEETCLREVCKCVCCPLPLLFGIGMLYLLTPKD